MPEFSTPFNGCNYVRKLNKDELIRAIRFSIAAEFEAVQLYEQLRDSIDDKKSAELLNEIADDEKIHAGNFLYLLKQLSPNDEKLYNDGEKEAVEVINDSAE